MSAADSPDFVALTCENSPSVTFVTQRAGQAGYTSGRRADKAEVDDVFGDELPQESSDEREPDSARDRDDWLRDNVPPHHN